MIRCPNCDSTMGEYEPCPECTHWDGWEGCECAYCESDDSECGD